MEIFEKANNMNEDRKEKEYLTYAIQSLQKEIEGLYEKGFIVPLLYEVAWKKIKYLMEAKSKSEIKEILRPSVPFYTGNEFVPKGKFHVEEEELLLWSLASLYAPLERSGFLRYQYLFQKYVMSNDKNVDGLIRRTGI